MPVVVAWVVANAVQICLLVATTLYSMHRAQQARSDAEQSAREQAAAARAAMNLKFNAVNNVGNIPLVYGRVRLGGLICLQEISADKKFLHIVIAHAEGECGPAYNLYLDGTLASDNKFKRKEKRQVKTGTVVERYATGNSGYADRTVDRYEEQIFETALVQWKYHSGKDDQAADGDLMLALPSKWTADHKLSGVAYSYVRLEWDPDVWRQVPNITVEMDGKLVTNPNDGQQNLVSANPARCLRDYLLSTRYGRGLSAADLIESSFTTEAAYCDQKIDMGHKDAGGAALPVERYRVNGMIDTAKSCMDNVQELLEHMRGSLLFIDGKYKLVLDKADVPVMQFNADNMVGKWQIKRADRRDKLNQITAHFVDPARNWEESVATVKNTAWKTEDAENLLERSLDYSLACDERRARYLAERALRNSRISIGASFTGLAAAGKLQPTDVISISHESTGWVNKLFRVVSVKPLVSGDVDVTVREYDAGLYTETPLTALPPLPATNLPDPFARLPAPASLVLTVDNPTNSYGEVQTRLKAVWPAVDGMLADYQVRWKKQSETIWQAAYTRDLQMLFVVEQGIPYDVSVAGVSALGRVGDARIVGATATGPSGTLVDVSGLVCDFTATGDFAFRWNPHPDVSKYAVEIITGGITRRTEVISGEKYTYTFALNKLDGLSRTVTCRVKAVAKDGRGSNWGIRTETRAAPAALGGLQLIAGYDAALFTCTVPADGMQTGIRVWAASNSGFAFTDDSFLIYDGPVTAVPISILKSGQRLAGGIPVYVRAAAYDAFGKTGLNISSELACTPLKLLAGLKPGEIDSILIKAVDAAKIAGTLQDWQIEGQADLKARVVKAEQDITGKAKASDVSILSATVGGFSSSITQLSQAQASTDGKLMAKWGVVLSGTTADGRKKLSGLQSFNDGVTSNFVITADQVLIGDLSNLIPDPNYMDMSWWGRASNHPIEDGGAPGWAKTTRRLTLLPEFNGESISKSFPVTPGAVYRLELVVYSNHAVGSLKVHMHIPGVRWAGFDGSWHDSPTIVSDGSWEGARWFSAEVTFPTNAAASSSNIRIVSNISSGGWVVGLVSIVRVSDSTLIADGAITTSKIKVNDLQSVNARTGNLIVDGGGSICSSNFPNYWSWPAAGQTGFHISERGILLGNPNYGNGSFFHYDVQNGSLEVRNGTVRASKIEASEINGSTFNARAGVDGNAGFQVFHSNGVALVRLGIFP
ncbi:phage tail protein [Iodobacter sp. CM08]|uniref:phage tail protein n=1 Tax=Iodobacter sp. CM08 TaxID=3085902 RepID=UPI002981BC9F|nr:phage tail protein [Iodobacter sp. CM08]MDW5417753.1 phage tail protein [Iodobacter sp. CM08]